MTRLRSSAFGLRAAADKLSFGAARRGWSRGRRGIGTGVATAMAIMMGGGSSVLACPVCFGAEETSMVDGTKVGILVLLAITFAVQGAFVSFFLYLRKRAKDVAEVELDTEWSELQKASRTLAAPRSDATSQSSVREANLRGWGPAGPQAR